MERLDPETRASLALAPRRATWNTDAQVAFCFAVVQGDRQAFCLNHAEGLRKEFDPLGGQGIGECQHWGRNLT